MVYIVADKRRATHRAVVSFQRELPFERLSDGSYGIETDFVEVYFDGFPSERHMDSLVPEGWEVIEQNVQVVPQDRYERDEELFWDTPDTVETFFEAMELVEEYA